MLARQWAVKRCRAQRVALAWGALRRSEKLVLDQDIRIRLKILHQQKLWSRGADKNQVRVSEGLGEHPWANPERRVTD